MRIAVVINTSWNIYNFRKGLIKGLINDGHELFAIAPLDEYSSKLHELGVKYLSLEMNAKGMNPFKDYLLMRKLKSCYRKNNIDVVLHYTIKPNIYGSWACRNISTRAINNVSGLGTTLIRENWVSKLVRRLYKFSFGYAEHVFFQNKEDMALFLDNGLVQQEKIGLLPGSGINFDEIPYWPLSYNENNVKFLFPARVLLDKGVNEFINASKLVKKKFGDKVSFYICGKPEENPKLGLSETQINEHVKDGFVNFLGHVDNLQEKMKEMDCVVLPSYREGTPRVLLEASCAGVFMITTDVPGCREVVSHETNGLLCNVKDTNSLYNCMLQFLQMDNRSRIGMREVARKLVEQKFDEKIVIDQYKNVLISL